MSSELMLEEGWRVVPEVSTKPLALVKFTRGSETHRARFDIDKRTFIDKIPQFVSSDKRDALVKSIIG